MNPILALASALLISSSLSAQLPDWTTLTPSAPSFFFCESSILAIEDTSGFHVWSSYTRAYSHLTVGPNRTFYGQDDSCVIVDPSTNTAYGYATHLGVFSPQPLNGIPVAATPNTGATWMVALVDGNDVHVFSGLLGTWTTMHFSATPSVAVARMVTVATDGVQTMAVSAHFGVPVGLGIAATTVDAVGYCGAARSAGYYSMFSAYRNRWRSFPVGAAATLLKPPTRAGYCVIQEPAVSTYYSAMTDSAVVLVNTPSATATLKDNVAFVQDGNTLLGYSSATGTISAVTTGASWVVVTAQQETIAAIDGTDVYAFGLLGGTWEQLPGAQLVAQDTGVVLAQTAANSYHAFSCMTNTWAAAPGGNYSTTYTTYNGVILIESSGAMQGFSANRGTWTQQVAPPADTYYRHKAAFCARSGTRLDAFNGRTGEWATVTTAAPATVTVFDMAVMADDGQAVYCYDCYRSDWSRQVCGAAQSQLRDECAYVYDGTTVFTWSGSSQISEWANMPEYWRVLARGGRMNVSLAAEPNSFAFAAIAPARANLMTPFGTLLVDPNSAVTLGLVVPPLGTAQLAIDIPDDPWLSGLTFFMQAAVMTPAATIYLTPDYYESMIM
ncbi:MAG: hypothetical protein KDC48_00175 [Planctomycetes bacterium]|nr:hypothetical protein [Planctomycetota bacterium]